MKIECLRNARHVLVTGGAGFIGSHFIERQLQAGFPGWIINVDKITYAAQPNVYNRLVGERYRLIVGDIQDQKLVLDLLRQYEIDTIVHFAAESHVDRSIQDPAVFWHTNLLGTYALLEAARRYWLEEREWKGEEACRFHHISTDEVYGSLSEDALPSIEGDSYAPRSPYSASKAAADHCVWSYFHTYGLPVTMSHCSNNYGPYQHSEKFIPTVIRCALNEQPIPLYGSGLQIRDWVHVTDHCAGIERIINRGLIGSTYHIGGHQPLRNRSVAEAVCHYCDQLQPEKAPHARLIQTVADRPGHDWRYEMDTHHIQAELQWFPQVSWEQGLKELIEIEKIALDWR